LTARNNVFAYNRLENNGKPVNESLLGKLGIEVNIILKLIISK
jgi:hypothetical protein